jgi:hypothetical protein
VAGLAVALRQFGLCFSAHWGAPYKKLKSNND